MYARCLRPRARADEMILRAGAVAARARVCAHAVSRRPPLRTAVTDSSKLIGLNDDQVMYQSLAREFSEAELKPNADKWDEEKIFPAETLREAAALGFGGIFVRDDVGGSGLGRLDGAVIFEELASGCTSTTAYLTIHNMCCWMIDTYGSDEQRQRWLPDLCSMETFSSYCLTEPGAGSDAASLSMRATRDGDDYVLNGSKAFISGGGRSDIYLIMCRTGDESAGGISCIAVEAGTKGLSFGAQERKLGWNSQPTAAVILDDCRVPAKNLIGEEGGGFKIAMAGLDGGRLSIGTCSIGAAQACWEAARDYISVRKQFGRPLDANQHIQFKMAEMASDIIVGRQSIRQAATLLDESHPDKTAFCAMAKRIATDNGFNVCNDALQLFGGYGYLRDYPIERFLRDVRVHQILEGTNEVMRMIIARNVLAPR